ncbi:transposase [Paenibacillus rhizoplanae]|uniref:transposase n=1 Tax=Paenibacillus rhizoplanae TaxID=1917181 RepID=UPI00361E17EF
MVRFLLQSGDYETVITNLSTAEFSPDELRDLYHLRWGIETSFRALKYTIGLTHFHAKKQESITQEIFARMILYNFAEMITSHVVISQKDKRHLYQVNFTVAVHVCRHFLRSKGDGPPPDVEALIRKNILPIRLTRPGQRNTRRIRSKSAISFVYRVA